MIQNILMEGDGMYPEGFHPMWPNITLACDGAAKQRFTRTRKPPRYYLSGFGSASYFPPSERNPLVFTSNGGNDDLPEQVAPYDPFPADVYCLGSAIHTFLLGVYRFWVLDIMSILTRPLHRTTATTGLYADFNSWNF